MIEFNNKPPKWENAGTEPTDAEKQAGYAVLDKVPAAYLNYHLNAIYKCIKELQTKLSNENTTRESEIVPINRGGTGATDKKTAFEGLIYRDSIKETNLLNCNTLTNSGIYRVYITDENTATANNFPARYGLVSVNSVTGYIEQTFYDVSGFKSHIRYSSNSGSTWSEWKKIYDTTNKPTPSDIGAMSSSDVERVKTLNLDISSGDYTSFVIPLIIVDDDTDNNYATGDFFFKRVNTAGARMTRISVSCGKKHGENIPYYTLSFDEVPSGNGVNIYPRTFTYNGRKWFGLYVEILSAAFNGSRYFVGRANRFDDIKIVSVYNSNTKTVLNEEIYNSLADEGVSLPRVFVGTPKVDLEGTHYEIYHEGNKPTPEDIGASTATAITNGNAASVGSIKTTSCAANAHYACALGNENVVSETGGFTAGGYSEVNGIYGATIGHTLVSNGFGQVVVGKRNVSYEGATSSFDTTGSIFIVGAGSVSGKANAFRVTNEGKCMGSSSFAASGADYAEYFEWVDGNPDNEDRRGYFVTLDGNKIRKANAEDDYILGVISSTPLIVGNAHTDMWQGMYLTDIFGERLTEIVDVPETTNEETGEIIPAHTEKRFIINPDYDTEQKYVGRNERKEWAAVGSHGQLVVIDNGECEVNGYCKVADGGTAIKSDVITDYRVIERLDSTHIRIFIK